MTLRPSAVRPGYTSIGCEPCTSLPLDAANARSGAGADASSNAASTFTDAPAADKL